MKLRALALSAISFAFLCGFGEKHSSVETKTSVKGDQLTVDVLVKPDPGMHLTKDGPWSLTLTDTKGLKLEAKDGKYVTKSFDESLPGFQVQAPIEAGVSSGHVNYDIKAFVCTEDKKQCFPQQHKGSFDWKKS